ncbi:MAG: MFS transporter [Pseudomonadota bacterium]
MTLKKQSIFIAAIGTMLEYYDYAIFSIFLPIIAPVFFPAHSRYDALVMGFYAVLISSIARPFGGVVFGTIGDKWGRKTALLISLCGIALATLAIGLLPGYLVLGVGSMIILTFIRSIQMICYGGEYSGAGIYVVEFAKGHKESFIGSIVPAMALVGSVIASMVGLIITMINENNPPWRWAFIAAGIIGIIAVLFRRHMAESASSDQLIDKTSFRQLFFSYPYQLLAGICIGGFITLPFTTVLSFVNPMLATQGYFSNSQFMALECGLSVIAVIVLLLSGMLADKYTPHKTMCFAAMALIILGVPMCFLLNSQNIFLILIAEISLIIMNEMLLGPSNAYLKSIFPADVRYRGVAFSFCLGMSLIGGLTLVVEHFLFTATGTLASLSIWLIFISSLTVFSLCKATKLSIQKSI